MEPFNYHGSNKDPNEALGQELFLWMYIVNTIIAYVIGISLYRLLLKVYDSEVERDQDFLFLVQFLTVTGIHFIALYFIDMVYYIYNWNNCNVFIVLKVVFMTIPVMVYVLFIAVKCDISRKALVGLTIVLLILSVSPTLLLFFAHPLNTFTLLVTHIALFYFETKTGMLVLNKCECCKCKRVMLPIGVVLMLILVYVIVMWFYQILFLRSLINDLAFEIFTKYIPGVVIAVFGYRYMYLIQQGTFFNKKKEDKKEENSGQS